MKRVIAINIFILFTLCISHGMAADENSFDPVIVRALPGTIMGSIGITRLNSASKKVDVYKGSAGSVGAFQGLVSPYIAISKLGLDKFYNIKCSGEQAEDFFLEFNVETGAGDLYQAAAKQIQGISSTDVAMYPYIQLRLIDTSDGRLIWSDPRSGVAGVAKNTPLSNELVRSDVKISCDDLYRYKRYANELDARARVQTSIESHNVQRLTYSLVRKKLLEFNLDQDAAAVGQLITNSDTSVKGKSRGSGLFGKVFGGSSKGSVHTNVVTTETDTRERWINKNGLYDAMVLVSSDISLSNYCLINDPNCKQSNIADALTSTIEKFIGTQILAIINKEDPPLADAYFAIDDPKTINRARSAQMNPSFSSQNSLNVDCKAVRDALVSPAGVPLPETSKPTAPTSNAQSPQGGWKTLPKTAGATKPQECGLSENISVADKNGTVWTFNGAEWVPTHLTLHYVGEQTFSGQLDTLVVNTRSSGKARNIEIGIPYLQYEKIQPNELNKINEKILALSKSKVTQCKVCFQEIEGSSQCQRTRRSCSAWAGVGAQGGWTKPFRDDTDRRRGGCTYQWKLMCR